MDITDVKVFLKEGQDKKLKAYATVTFDNCFVVRNVKVIEGNKGMFVAMPSRKMKDPCPKCHFRNTVRSKFCNQCGSTLPQSESRPAMRDAEDMARQSEHKDIAHPITTECRDYIQKKVLEAYDIEKAGGASSPSKPAVFESKPVSSGSKPVSFESKPAPEASPRRGLEEESDIEL